MDRSSHDRLSFTLAAKSGNQLFLYVVALLIPMTLGLYWPSYTRHPFGTAAILRPIVFAVSVTAALLWGHLRLTAAEIKLAGVLGLFCLIWLGTSFGATDIDRALLDWVKLVALCVIALLLSRTLRYQTTSKGFGHALIGASMAAAALIVLIYLRTMGLTIPSYQSARHFKGIMQTAGISLNAIAFTSVFAYVTGMCLVRTSRLLWALGGVLLVIATVFTGSRAPLTVVVASTATLVLINALRSSRLPIRYLAFVALAVLLVAIPLLLSSVPFSTMSALTEGRWDLWSVAWQKFTERPLIGFGYESWRDDLASRLPGVYKTTKSLGKEVAGGYHNEYLTVLAEQGLLGFIPVIVVCWFAVQSSWRLAFGKWRTWRNGQWALFTTLFLLFRACLEIPGLFGYGQEPADFLAYIFLAILVSRFSIEEDHATSARHAPSLPSASF